MQSLSNSDRIRAADSSSDAPWRAPLLITGCPRTGTSALARMLSTHEMICIFNEYSLYYPPEFERNVWERIDGMDEHNPPPTKISPNMASLRSRLIAELPRTASSDETRKWLFGRLPHPVAVYGDKMPFEYLKAMEEIVKEFPGVKFLLTLRDGRAVVASQIRSYHAAVRKGVTPDPWMKPTVEEAEFLWLRSARKWLPLRDDPPAPCLEVRYEEATKSPEELLRNFCNFVGMNYCRDDFHEFLDGYRPVHTDAWREEIPDLEARLSPEFRDALTRLDYE